MFISAKHPTVIAQVRKKRTMKKTPSYGRIKEITIGGIFMSRSYRHIQQYETEILALKKQGKTQREIGEQLGFTKNQVKEFFHRYNIIQRKLAAGIALKRKGRPTKKSIVSKQDNVAELKYMLARKDAKIKSLEMENELMRDFLSHTERK